jgi:hypothetical protein
MRWLCCLLFACAAMAQERRDSSLQSELNRMDRLLKQNQSEVDHLLDLRLNHDRGLPNGDSAELFRHEAPVTPASIAQATAQLKSEERKTADLVQQFEKLKQVHDRVQAAQAKPEGRRPDEEWTSVPQPGSRPVRRPGDPVPPPQPASVGETQTPVAVPVPVPALNLLPIKGQIHGSSDHARTAGALFRAAQSLMERAEQLRAQGDAAQAAAWDKEARERLDHAVNELKPLLEQQPPAFADLFALGRCREALFRLAELHDGLSLRSKPKDYQQREQEVREPFVAITARDSVSKKGVETLGPWGRAAQTALDHFRWMNVHGRFTPSRALESITWERERSK